MKKSIVIGSGIAGMAMALRLRRKGHEVIVFEANHYPGGKLHAFKKGKYRFDAGPSLFTMPWLVSELFELFGLDSTEYFTYQRKETICNYFWEDGTTFQAHADLDTFAKEAEETFKISGNLIKKYLTKSQQKYDLTKEVFLEKSLHRISTYWSFNTFKSLLNAHKLDINKSLHQLNTTQFANDKLVQIFDRYATYNGSSPYRTPGIMSLIPHLEMLLGTYLPANGMHDIILSLYKLAVDRGVKFHFGERVKIIDHSKNQVEGVTTVRSKYLADIVVSNMDIFTTYSSLLTGLSAPERRLKQERSSSALIFYWGINSSFPNLDLHNILFSHDYDYEFKCLFETKTLFDDPTVYINITSKEVPNDAPSGCENWFVMINTPSNVGQDWNKLKQTARSNIVNKINKILKVDIEKFIEVEECLDPVTIESKTGSYQGSLYGTSSNSRFSAFFRHPNFSRKLKGLYFCGGSVHPGGGIPLCLNSAKIAADLIT